MAEMSLGVAKRNTNIILVAGERVSIRILNADGSVKLDVCDDAVPAGKTLNGATGYAGALE